MMSWLTYQCQATGDLMGQGRRLRLQTHLEGVSQANPKTTITWISHRTTPFIVG